jgi:hypothetical protein
MKLGSYRAIVLETNVLMTASEHAPQASDECVRQCVSVIEQVKQGTPTLALDNSGLILDEYQKRLRAYPNSIGYMFLRKWLDSNWHNIVLVDIQPINAEQGRFRVLPKRVLKGLDRDDKKFVATAVAAQNKLDNTVPIVNAVDSDYAEHFSALHALGVYVEFLCPEVQPINAESGESPSTPSRRRVRSRRR